MDGYLMPFPVFGAPSVLHGWGDITKTVIYIYCVQMIYFFPESPTSEIRIWKLHIYIFLNEKLKEHTLLLRFCNDISTNF